MTANTPHPVLRGAVIIILSCATAGMIAVSLRANFLFGYACHLAR